MDKANHKSTFINKIHSEYIESQNSNKITKRQYIHFDQLVFSGKMSEKTITKKAEILFDTWYTELGQKKHNFLPLLRVNSVIKKHYLIKNVKKVKKEIKKDKKYHIKPRPLTYCGHLDKIIYLFWGIIWEDLYEKKLLELGLQDNVLAYRKIPKNNYSNKSNIDFARDAFESVKLNVYNNQQCTTIALDISSFFDNISHNTIKENLTYLTDREKLDYFDYKIFKQITNYNFIDKKRLLQNILLIKNKKQLTKFIYGYTNRKQCKEHHKTEFERQKQNKKLKQRLSAEEYTNQKQHKEEYFGQFCKKNKGIKEIIKKIRAFEITNPGKNLIYTKNNKNYGIPQGLPISGLISNISLIKIDIQIKELCSLYSITYYRYCDDILLVIPSNSEVDSLLIKDLVIDILQFNKGEKYNRELEKYETKPFLEINNKKTEIRKFELCKDKVDCFEIENNNKTKRKPMQYLGFNFDGQNITIRQSGISKYYSKMRRSIKSIKCLFKKRKYQNLPFKRIRLQYKDEKKRYLKYVDNSFHGMENNNKIKRQVSKRLVVLNSLLESRIN